MKIPNKLQVLEKKFKNDIRKVIKESPTLKIAKKRIEDEIFPNMEVVLPLPQLGMMLKSNKKAMEWVDKYFVSIDKMLDKKYSKPLSKITR